MEPIEKKTVGQIVANDYRTAQVFRKFGLDFCCGGDKTIEEAAENKNINPTEVRKALQKISADDTSQENYNSWSLNFLTGHIVNAHHKYTRNKMPEIEAYAKKVAKVHGKDHPELHKICQKVINLHSDLIEHLDKEEEVLFPYIKRLVEISDSKGEVISGDDSFSKAADPVAMMEDEHEEAGEAMARIRQLSNDFRPPEDACTTYELLFQNLEYFEKDLHKHVHLENNILFPKALELEERLNKN